MAYQTQIPVNVITGFLGSGKTTLLQDLLTAPVLDNTAVLVNEFGEVGLDHHLFEEVAESTLLLENGCVCCAIRGDLQQALKDLHSRRTRGEIPPFDRVVVETTGLADPVPIAYTVLSEPVIQHHFRLGHVVTTVDAVNGPDQLARFDETRKQAAIADRLVITKTDLAEAGGLEAALRRLNPDAPILRRGDDPIDAEALLTGDAYDPAGKAAELERWLALEETGGHDHDSEFQSISFTFETPLDWTAFGVWTTMLLHRHGERLLRLKALLNVDGLDGPVLVNGVQHLIHPPAHLGAWTGPDRRSRIVLIGQHLDRAAIETSLAAFNRLANPSPAATTPVDRQAGLRR